MASQSDVVHLDEIVRAYSTYLDDAARERLSQGYSQVDINSLVRYSKHGPTALTEAIDLLTNYDNPEQLRSNLDLISYYADYPDQLVWNTPKMREAQEHDEMLSNIAQARAKGVTIAGMSCGRCKGTSLEFKDVQMRSADEGMDTLATCMTCNYQWKL